VTTRKIQATEAIRKKIRTRGGQLFRLISLISILISKVQELRKTREKGTASGTMKTMMTMSQKQIARTKLLLLTLITTAEIKEMNEKERPSMAARRRAMAHPALTLTSMTIMDHRIQNLHIILHLAVASMTKT
jgi:hypothetical protein